MRNLLAAGCLLVAFPTAWSFAPLTSSFSVRRPSVVQLDAVKTWQSALLFDCDGVILETEELHRLAYNQAFDKFDLTINGEPVVWSVEYYDVLQNTVGGGKPKMRHHFLNTMQQQWPCVGDQPAPTTTKEQDDLIDALQDYKTNQYKELLQSQAEPRPGILNLMDQALAHPLIAVGVCSAATKAAAEKTLQLCLGPERLAQLDVCILGDDVAAKKPDPLIYNTARERLGVPDSQECVVVEDSLVGLRAAVAAQMKCVITYTSGTEDQDFYGEGAHATVPNAGNVQLSDLFDETTGQVREDLLTGKKDPVASPASS